MAPPKTIAKRQTSRSTAGYLLFMVYQMGDITGKKCIPDHIYRNYGVENGTGISCLEVEHDTIVVLAKLVI